jgi:hypothetical protein
VAFLGPEASYTHQVRDGICLAVCVHLLRGSGTIGVVLKEKERWSALYHFSPSRGNCFLELRNIIPHILLHIKASSHML